MVGEWMRCDGGAYRALSETFDGAHNVIGVRSHGDYT
jgi:hypothetical protein